MPFEIPDNLNPQLMALAWMVGRWAGNGHGTWPNAQGEPEEFEFGQQIDFTTNGGPYLHYISQTYKVDAEGRPAEPLGMETGFWRPQADSSLEVVMSSPEGWSEVWTGKITGAKIELVTDAVMRTQTAATSYTGGQRLYGNVEGDLLYTFDRATEDVALQSYQWARLQRVESATGVALPQDADEATPGADA